MFFFIVRRLTNPLPNAHSCGNVKVSYIRGELAYYAPSCSVFCHSGLDGGAGN